MADEESLDLDSFTLISTSTDDGGSLVDKFKKGKEWIQNTQASTSISLNKL